MLLTTQGLAVRACMLVVRDGREYGECKFLSQGWMGSVVSVRCYPMREDLSVLRFFVDLALDSAPAFNNEV